MKVMKSCHKLRVDLKEVNIGYAARREHSNQSMNTILSESTHSNSVNYVNKKKVPNTVWVAKHT